MPADSVSRSRRTILVGFDVSERARDVLRAAEQIATHRGASLIAAHVSRRCSAFLPEAGFLADVTTPDELVATVFPTVVESLYDSEVHCELVALVGDTATELAELARQRAVDAIVLGASTPGRRGRVRRLLSGSVPHRLRTLQPVPVITVPALTTV